MGVAGFICPGDGQTYDTETYLRMAREGELFERGIPFHFAALKTMAFERDVAGVSATELLGCARKWFLQREYPYYIRPEKTWRLYRGTSIHAAIEGQVAGDTDALFIAETRFFREVDLDGETVSISGQVDNFWPYLGQGVIADHKDKAYAAKKGPADARHILQLSIYAWIIDGDESANVPTPRQGGIYYQDGKGPVLKRFDLLPLAEVETFVQARLREFRGHGQGTYPEPLRDEEDQKLMCSSCPVKHICDELRGKGK